MKIVTRKKGQEKWSIILYVITDLGWNHKPETVEPDRVMTHQQYHYQQLSLNLRSSACH